MKIKKILNTLGSVLFLDSSSGPFQEELYSILSPGKKVYQNIQIGNSQQDNLKNTFKKLKYSW